MEHHKRQICDGLSWKELTAWD